MELINHISRYEIRLPIGAELPGSVRCVSTRKALYTRVVAVFGVSPLGVVSHLLVSPDRQSDSVRRGRTDTPVLPGVKTSLVGELLAGRGASGEDLGASNDTVIPTVRAAPDVTPIEREARSETS